MLQMDKQIEIYTIRQTLINKQRQENASNRKTLINRQRQRQLNKLNRDRDRNRSQNNHYFNQTKNYEQTEIEAGN